VLATTHPVSSQRPAPSVQSLTSARRELIALFQRLNFGRVEGLVVRDSEPVLDPPPRVTKEFKFGGDNAPRPEAGLQDFVLKNQHRDLFQVFDDLGNGVVPVITVQNGLPFRAELPL